MFQQPNVPCFNICFNMYGPNHVSYTERCLNKIELCFKSESYSNFNNRVIHKSLYGQSLSLFLSALEFIFLGFYFQKKRIENLQCRRLTTTDYKEDKVSTTNCQWTRVGTRLFHVGESHLIQSEPLNLLTWITNTCFV